MAIFSVCQTDFRALQEVTVYMLRPVHGYKTLRGESRSLGKLTLSMDQRMNGSTGYLHKDVRPDRSAHDQSITPSFLAVTPEENCNNYGLCPA